MQRRIHKVTVPDAPVHVDNMAKRLKVDKLGIRLAGWTNPRARR